MCGLIKTLPLSVKTSADKYCPSEILCMHEIVPQRNTTYHEYLRRYAIAEVQV